MKSLILAAIALLSVADARSTWKRQAGPPPQSPCQETLLECVSTYAPDSEGPGDTTCQQMIDIMKCVIPHLPTCDDSVGSITQILHQNALIASQPPRNCDISGLHFPVKGGNENEGSASAETANKRESAFNGLRQYFRK